MFLRPLHIPQCAVNVLAVFALPPYLSGMNLRTRKFIGVFGGTAYLILYSLIAMAIAGSLLADLNKIVQLFGFALAGILWLPGMMMIIRWMSKDS